MLLERKVKRRYHLQVTTMFFYFWASILVGLLFIIMYIVYSWKDGMLCWTNGKTRRDKGRHGNIRECVGVAVIVENIVVSGN